MTAKKGHINPISKLDPYLFESKQNLNKKIRVSFSELFYVKSFYHVNAVKCCSIAIHADTLLIDGILEIFYDGNNKFHIFWKDLNITILFLKRDVLVIKTYYNPFAFTRILDNFKKTYIKLSKFANDSKIDLERELFEENERQKRREEREKIEEERERIEREQYEIDRQKMLQESKERKDKWIEEAIKYEEDEKEIQKIIRETDEQIKIHDLKEFNRCSKLLDQNAFSEYIKSITE